MLRCKNLGDKNWSLLDDLERIMDVIRIHGD